MFNKKDFFTELGIFIKNETDLDWEEVGIYLDIIDQYPNYINYILGESVHYNMKYTPPEDEGWNASNGSIVIGEYKIELCCYGDLSINIYKNDEYIEALTFDKCFDINERISDIHEEIRVLVAEKRMLLESLKQMA